MGHSALQRPGLSRVASAAAVRVQVVDTLLQVLSALIVGLLHGTTWGISSIPSNVVMNMTCLGVLSVVAHLRTFSQVPHACTQQHALWPACAALPLTCPCTVPMLACAR